jgi:hypothetical protein
LNKVFQKKEFKKMAVAVSILEGSRIVSESDGLVEITFLTTSFVPFGELVTVDFEIVPGKATPQENYEYESPSAIFVRQTGIYADRISIPSGASLGSISINILQDEIVEGNEDFTVNITGVSSNAQVGDNASISVTIEDDTSSSVLYRVNAGGPEIAAIDGGPNWLADVAFLQDLGSDNIFQSSVPVALGDTVPSTTPGEIFNTERFDAVSDANDTEMQYAFAVNPGIYEVRLYVANTFDGTSLPGQRVFDVAIEGQILPNLNNIDPSADFGNLVGGMLSNKVEVIDGSLNIEFLHDAVDGAQNPLINGIEIIQIGDASLQPTVGFVGEPYIVSEDSELSQITLLTSKPVADNESVTITFDVVPGSATPLEDYRYDSITATFDPVTGIYTDSATIPSGFSVSDISINILQDAIAEASEAFTINITDVDSYFQIGTNSSISVTIEDSSSNSAALLSEAEAILYSGYPQTPL